MVTRSSRRMMVAPAALPKSKDLRRSKDMQDWMEAAPVGQEQASNIRNHSSSRATMQGAVEFVDHKNHSNPKLKCRDHICNQDNMDLIAHAERDPSSNSQERRAGIAPPRQRVLQVPLVVEFVERRNTSNRRRKCSDLLQIRVAPAA